MSRFASLQNRLLRWYQKNARDLPWRKTKNPYKIWVSEIMLQQTQVATVIPYYNRWLKRFPTLASLAKAPISEALKFWAGLGYYRRVRMLHEAARVLMKKSGGRIPRSVEDLLEIHGIGRYTAGAISSIAFDEKAPLLDGNVIRILTRIFAVKEDIDNPSTMRKLWRMARSVLPEKQCGDFNQAMMELGATVCLPDRPACQSCPVENLCKAHRLKKETAFPVRRQKEIGEKMRTAALIVRRNGRVLIQKQPAQGRWGGLWMFPHWKSRQAMLAELNLNINDLSHRLTIRHGFTKYQICLNVFEYKTSACKAGLPRHCSEIPGVDFLARPPGHTFDRPALQASALTRKTHWVQVKNLSRFPFPSPHQKIVQHLMGRHG